MKTGLPIDYESARPPKRRSVWRPVLDALAILSLPGAIIAGLAAFDGIRNPHSDFVPGPWLILFMLFFGVEVWWVVLKRGDRGG